MGSKAKRAEERSKPKVVFADNIFADLEVEQEILARAGAEVVLAGCKTGDEMAQVARDADALVAYGFKPIDEALMSRLKNCRLIVRGGIGVDTIDVPAATRNGIIVTNIPSYCVEEVSTHTLALMLALLQKLPVAMKKTACGEWSWRAVQPLRTLSSLTAGIIGFGAIGRASARRVHSLGMKIIFYDPFVKESVNFGGWKAEKTGLDELLAGADAVLLHAPATPATAHIINRDALGKIKRGAVLVNTARGQLVDTDALVSALKDGKLGGAGLDLIENVPPFDKDHPLLTFDNVIVTPYCAWYTEDSVFRVRTTVAEEIARVLRGYFPKAVVNPDVKSHARANHLKEERK